MLSHVKKLTQLDNDTSGAEVLGITDPFHLTDVDLLKIHANVWSDIGKLNPTVTGVLALLKKTENISDAEIHKALMQNLDSLLESETL